MDKLLHLFILLPLAGFIISLLIPKKNEGLISWTTFGFVGLHFGGFLLFFTNWLLNGHPTLNLKDIVLYQTDTYTFLIDFCFDKITAVYLFVGGFLTFLVTIYSRRYLHREEGYKRFFNTMLLFYFGYNITIFAGNFETLFIGWEILGICSFLLIAFYRDRYLPVKNAYKVFSVYRIGDVGLILAMWASHHLWEENITFFKLNNDVLMHTDLENHSVIGVFISVMILVAAAAKSAQLPFSSWLPRAMEGPTPSSAIFYGSLSVHIGVFLLLRTVDLWENQISVRILIVLLGLSTAVIGTLTSRVQSTIKSQIAYSSVAQIGIIFIEVAFGFEKIALFHFAGNAFLRTYQLLVSPSSVSYLIREQFYNFVPRKQTIEDSFPRKLQNSVYMLSVKEWNLDGFMNYILWDRLHKAGKILNFLTIKRLLIFFIPSYIIGLVALYEHLYISEEIHEYLPTFIALIGLVAVLKAFSERTNVLMSWIMIIMNHFCMALAVSFNEDFNYDQVHLYLSGVVIAGIVGYLCIRKLKSLEGFVDINQFYGHSYEHPKLAFIFLLSCLGLTGFPITPTFIGEDVIFTHIHKNQIVLAFFCSLSFIVTGIALIRIYSRIFLGPHIKTYHETPYRSS
ncbi:MAG: proton-conducting transporter transmembrane domain-containing protein [Bacteroidia bacterium]